MNRMHDLKLTTAEVHDLIRGMILHESGNMQLSHAVNASKDKHKILQSVYDFQFNDALYPEHDFELFLSIKFDMHFGLRRNQMEVLRYVLAKLTSFLEEGF